ncbi:MAG: acyl-ACP--UDP-N-acetylglucosamine O-acyltransferase [Saprospiraceae bacterium]|nr:acyl-ACP--UDP-N-acetylglucosamine O-acyltransferase [Saprospiraceae bacterium]
MNYNNLQVIHPDANIGKGVQIGPFVSIAADVVIGEGTWIGANVSIMEGVRIGKNCKIFPGAIVGGIPQDLKFEGERTLLEIGDNVIIREYCTLNRGTKANNKTVIGSNCLLMAYVHVAHDCVISNNCILANNVNLAGHIEIGEHAVLGGLTAVHQFVKIGAHTMIGGGSLVSRDIPPFIKAARNPLSYAGVNSLGLKRRGFSKEQIHSIQDIYRILFVRGGNVGKSLKQIKVDIPDSDEKDTILEFIANCERGLLKGFKTRINGD